MFKPISKMTVEEILRQQLELLAEFSQSEHNDARDLAELTKAMVSLADYLPNKQNSPKLELKK